MEPELHWVEPILPSCVAVTILLFVSRPRVQWYRPTPERERERECVCVCGGGGGGGGAHKWVL